MNKLISRTGFAGLIATAATFLAAGSPASAAAGKVHKVAFHIDVNDPATMNLLLGNFANLMAAYAAASDPAQVEIVAYGPGLHMLRADTSPVKDRLTALKTQFPGVTYSACHNTLVGMEKTEGHPIVIVPEARVVPAGVVRLVELQEQGYVYIKP
jgi:intracellular sulfur oxidation DsrE/DsrF family protein